jgi:FkbM family methyltransferase
MMLAHSIANLLINKSRLPGSYKMAAAVSKLLLPARPGKVRCPTIYDFDLVLERGGSRAVYSYGFYEPGTLDVMRRILRPGDFFVDAGASVGLMTLYASKLVGSSGRVLSFEPLPRRFTLLTESVRLNNADNVRLFNLGLGREPGVATIFTDRVSPSLIPAEGSTRGESVQVERLADVLAREKISAVRMIKIDVEGSELAVLQGCHSVLSGARPPALCVEYGVYDRGSDQLITFLKSLPGYRLFNLSGTKGQMSELREVSAFRTGDNIFCIPDGLKISD